MNDEQLAALNYKKIGGGNWWNFGKTDYANPKGGLYSTQGYGDALGLGLQGAASAFNIYNQYQANEIAQENLDWTKKYGKLNANMQLGALYDAKNKNSKYAGFFGAINNGASWADGSLNNELGVLNNKYNDKEGVVQEDGSVKQMRGAEEIVGKTGDAASPGAASVNPKTAGTIKKKLPASASDFNKPVNQ